MVARSAQHFRIAPEEESDRTAVRALGAGVKTTGSRRVQRPLADFAEPPQSKRCNLLRRNSAVFCARSVSTSVRSRRRCPADTFGATFWCQKVVNLLLAGNAESKVRDTSRSKNRFLLCFWIKPKYQKINRGENICFFMIPDKNRIENRRFSF